MADRIAFTAKYWGEKAVVCRSREDLPGPVIEQEFGEFESWTQANHFAMRLNEGLEVDPSAAEQIITGSMLHTGEILREADAAGCCNDPRGDRVLRKAVGLQFLLAQLELAATFCRMVRTKPSQNTKRLMWNARNALFNAMDYVVRGDVGGSDLEAVTGRLEKLRVAFHELTVREESAILAACEGRTVEEEIRDLERMAQ